MFQSNKIHDNVLHNNFAPNYIFDVENSNDIENANYSFQFWGNSTQDLKGGHLLAYNNNYVSESFSISEWNLYGSSRLGARNIDKVADVVFLASRNYNWVNSTVTNEYIAPTASFTYKKYRLLGAKTFELTNHLGNVISTVSDRKLMVQDAQNLGFVHHYKPEILSIGEQYAFGMSMPGRTFSVEDYRYGFNGKENQDELLGEDNSQDFGARMYDARVGRWWGLDPNQNSYAHLSPYNAMENNPIYFNDPDGKDAIVTIEGNQITISSVIFITGAGATYMEAWRIQNEIMKKFAGNWNLKNAGKEYNIKFNVVVKVWNPSAYFEPLQAGENLIDVGSKGSDFRSYVTDGRYGFWNTDDRGCFGHEFCHILGLDDGYMDYPKCVGTDQSNCDPDIKSNVGYIKKENYGKDDLRFKPENKVTQELINDLGGYILSHKGNSNSFLLKGGMITKDSFKDEVKLQGLPNSWNNKSKQHSSSNPIEKKASKSANPKSSSKKSSKPKSSGGQTRYKNPRFL